jgi:predicted alpha/beta superfamily hydrolase
MCKWIVVVLLLLPAVPAGGQTPGQTVERHTLKSAELGDEREIWVALPRDYAAGSQRYQVLYVLDADGLFPPAAAYASYLPLGDAMPPLIVVGVRSKSMEDRNRVFTPAPGVADRFLAFLTKEVRPLVERTYRTQPVATLAGHSMAGLFAVYALATAPESFDAYFAFSPVLAWRGGAALAPLEAFLRRERTTPKSLYLSVAHEPQFPQEPVERAVRLLEERAGPSLRWTFARFDGEDHFTTVPPALWGALRWHYGGRSERHQCRSR